MNKEKVTEFLKVYKSFAQKRWVFVYRKKNLDSLTELGIMPKQAKKVILGLTAADYCSGPEEDRDRKGTNMWVFGAKVNDEEIYIKLSDDFRGEQAKCVSFHKAEFPIRKPFEERGD